MIEFQCKNCGQKLSVQDQHSGKRVKCPKCGSVVFVPDNSDKINFHCKNCGQSIRVPQIYASKKGKCPKCKNVVVVPTREATPAKSTSMVSFTCSMCDETVQVLETSLGKTIECPECGSYIETSSGAAKGKSDASADEDLYEEETEEYEGSEGVDKRIIVSIAATAAVVVVGLIILAVVLRSSGSRPAGRTEELGAQRQVADTDSRPQPVTSDTHPTEQIVQEPPKEDALPEEHGSLENKLYEQTKIAFVSSRDGNDEIYVMNTDGSGQKRLTNNPARDINPSWSPDGMKIIFQSRREGNTAIYVMNADGSEQRKLTNNSHLGSHPSWSPDGKRIAFVSHKGITFEIYVMNIDGSGERCLTDHTRAFHDGAVLGLLDLCWSPGAKKIAFTTYKDGNLDLYVINADGSEQKNLTNSAVSGSPSWSPDGKKIAFHARRGSTVDIYVMNPDGSEQKRLTNNRLISIIKNRLHCISPSWSPDGKKIAFHARTDVPTDVPYSIYVMNADGRKQTRLTNNPASDSDPSWSPFLPSEPQLVEEPEREQEAVDDINSRPVASNSQPEEPVEAVPLPKPGDVVANSIGMKLVYIPAGSFMMGSGDSAAQLAKEYNVGERRLTNEFPQHQVRISEGFWMGQTEVTQGHYTSVMNAQPWSGEDFVQEDANNPAVHVSWDEATEFCTKLSKQEDKTYRLPTEAEWEYACRAGTTTRFSFGNSGSFPGDYAWFYDNAFKVGQRYAHPVGQKKPNPWDLYDMHGNVWEWCSDWYNKEYYSNSPSADPNGPPSGRMRSLRGGSWDYGGSNLRCSDRSCVLPDYRDSYLGFRVVRSQP